MHCHLCLFALLIASAALGQLPDARGRVLRSAPRGVPRIRPGQPGNVFARGDAVSVPAPAELRDKAVSWRATDLAEVSVGAGAMGDACRLGTLPVGWYRIDFLDGEGGSVGWTTCAVIEPPSLPTPDDSPVCVDAATAWFARGSKERREGFAYLAGIARANWIRDRLSWSELEPAPGRFAESGTIYDASADAQAERQLSVLQVFHSTPKWALDPRLDDAGEAWKRFPRDLRHLHSFLRGASRRYVGKVLAWEPWNEANITGFGGHTIDEMCTLQKAAYFGIKAGSPHATVCWNVYAGAGGPLHTEGVLRNQVWPYFETYNIHSYSPPDSYEREFAGARDAASGRPIWISECGIRLHARTEKPWGEMDRFDEYRQAEFLPRSYAASLYSGVDRHFFFILGNYWERGIQFGLLRHDLTPRPGYVALAAAGRFLASARCLGRLTGDGYEMIAFSARPDGRRQTVLVGWAKTARELPLDGIPHDAVYDCYGRPTQAGLGPVPCFVVLPDEAAGHLSLTPPPARAEPRSGKPSPIVLQAQFRASTCWLHGQAHRLPAGAVRRVPLCIYNFSSSSARGTIAVREAPERWRIDLPAGDLVIPPGERLETSMSITLPRGGDAVLGGGWVALAGAFGHLGDPVLAFRLAADVGSLEPAARTPVASAADPRNWVMNINKGSSMSAETGLDAGTAFAMDFGDGDPWAYPYLVLPESEIPGADCAGVEMTVQLLEGEGRIRCQFTEESGATYLGEFDMDPGKRTPQKAMALFRYATWGSYSEEDPNHKLDPEQIRRLLVGINAKPNSRVRMVVRDVHWVKF